MKKSSLSVLGIAIIIISALLGIYIGGWLLFVGGIVNIIHGAVADPINAIAIAIGVLKFVCSGFVGWLTFIIGSSFGVACIKTADEM